MSEPEEGWCPECDSRDYSGEVVRLRAEVERLTSELRTALDAADLAARREETVQALYESRTATLLEEQSDNERLREALARLVRVYDVRDTRHDGILGMDWDSRPDSNAASFAWAEARAALVGSPVETRREDK